ncbi:MAG: hypothetical protein U1F27_09480 [Turneriella sp.]
MSLFLLNGFLYARISQSIGYGLQLNSMLNSTLTSNLQRLVTNSGGQPLVGRTGTTDYASNWSASGDNEIAQYPLIGLPEIRMVFSWGWGNNSLGIFSALTGVVPQTSAYYLGSLQLRESKTCAGVDATNCPLAAVNFVSSSGTALYDTEVRTNLRSFNMAVGMTIGRKIGNAFQGELSLIGEFGLNIQSFAVTTQFAGARCTTGVSAPCAQVSQSRVVQGELKTQSNYALGPVLGVSLRYERPLARWFLEAGATATFLFTSIENVGYTNFVAGGTTAYTQTSAALGIDAVQNTFAILPAIMLRFGLFL